MTTMNNDLDVVLHLGKWLLLNQIQDTLQNLIIPFHIIMPFTFWR